jgi:hypothetical protein
MATVVNRRHIAYSMQVTILANQLNFSGAVDKRIIAQLVKKFPGISATQKFITCPQEKLIELTDY